MTKLPGSIGGRGRAFSVVAGSASRAGRREIDPVRFRIERHGARAPLRRDRARHGEALGVSARTIVSVPSPFELNTR
jgi:hypothetical protein